MTLLFSLLLLLVAGAAVHAQEPLPGQTIVIETSRPVGPMGSCLTATSNSDGAAVVLQECGPNPAAVNSWVVPEGNGAVGQLRIFGDKCLDVKDGVDSNGSKLQIWSCSVGNTNQLWVPQLASGGNIVWSGKNKCIDLTDGNTANGTPVQVWDCPKSPSDNANQAWSFATVTLPKAISISPQAAPSLCVTAPSNTTDSPIVLSSCSSSSDSAAAQTFSLENQGSQVGGLQVSAGLCMAPASKENGAKIVLADCGLPSNTIVAWSLPRSYTGSIRNIGAGNGCLDLTDGAATSGTQLQLWSCVEGNDNQRWTVTYRF
ncbi:ricin B lectin domain-containing protein [Favolaschia claudopus]|uniref:Ricin B lectin domain-containing protein n=1 Tax=Favolaschia claudopus TaxID=2862362 RepID=A0AAW0A0V4_9AGAR